MPPRLSTAIRLRVAFEKFFAGRASYVVLQDESKEPRGRYRIRNGKTPVSRVTAIPSRGNYGVIPECDFFILDIDVHRSKPEEQIRFFEELFGVDLSKTLCVRTPSGGMHFYLRLPPNHPPVFNGSLRSYNKILNEHSVVKLDYVDADIRSSDAAGYVVGPGSYVTVGKNGEPYKTPGEYKLLGESKKIIENGTFEDIAEVSNSGLALLSFLRTQQLAKKAPKPDASNIQETRRIEANLNSKMPSAKALKRIERKLNRTMEFHRQRYFVYKALHCCYNDYGVALACEALNIARDNYTENKLTFWETVDDVHRLRGVASGEHTGYCDAGYAERHPDVEVPSNEEKLRKIREKLANRANIKRKHTREPRVINMERAIRVLDSGRVTVPQRTADAVKLLDLVFQPLVNIGATRIVIAKKPVAEKLGFTESRITEALRLLRAKKIIEVKDKPRPGLAATYIIPNGFLNKRLTGGLKHRWRLIHEARQEAVFMVYDRWKNVYVEIDSKKTYRTDVPKSKWRKEFNLYPNESIFMFAEAYLRKTASR